EPPCLPNGSACSEPSQCCSGDCAPDRGTCVDPCQAFGVNISGPTEGIVGEPLSWAGDLFGDPVGAVLYTFAIFTPSGDEVPLSAPDSPSNTSDTYVPGESGEYEVVLQARDQGCTVANAVLLVFITT